MDLKKAGKLLGDNQIAFISHCGSGKFKRGILQNCYTRGTASSFGLSTINVQVNNCYFEKMSSKCIVNVSDTTSIKNSFFEVAYLNNTTNEQGDVAYKNTTFIKSCNPKYVLRFKETRLGEPAITASLDSL
jgi:hypothetical protein